MSDFRDQLERICTSVEGAVAATVMGMDGLPIETVEAAEPLLGEAGDPVDIASLLVEYSALLGQVAQSAQVFAAGGLEEMSIRSTRLTTIIRPVTPEYFVALALRPDANFGKGRYLLRLTAPALASELY